MRFLLDYDVPDDLSYLLEQLGHDVTLLRKELPGDSPDESVFRFACDAGYILLTCNRDDFLRLAEMSARRCFGCSSVLARPVSETTSISPDRLRRLRLTVQSAGKWPNRVLPSGAGL